MELDIIYNEDCLKGLKELPDHSIDLIVTDPPYLISATNGGGTINKVKKLNESLKDLTTVDITKGYDIELFNAEFVRVMKEINIYEVEKTASRHCRRMQQDQCQIRLHKS